VLTDWGSFSVSEVARHGTGTFDDPDDIALLVFDEPVALPEKNHMLPLLPGLEMAQAVQLVGFGCNSLEKQTGTNIKRAGKNRVHRKTEFIEIASPRNIARSRDVNSRSLLGPDNLAATCFGDSGSPLLREYGGGWGVSAVSHGGKWNEKVVYSLFSDLSRDSNTRFLSAAENRYGLNLLNPCEDPSITIPQCRSFQALTGIVSLLRKIFGWLFGWML
jgi:hypothetical protein